MPDLGLYFYMTQFEQPCQCAEHGPVESISVPFVSKVESFLPTMVILQVDDSVIVRTESLSPTEYEMSAVLLSKPTKSSAAD